MHHNVSMFDAHRIPPLFPDIPPAHLGMPQEERVLSLVLLMEKVLSFLQQRLARRSSTVPAGSDARGSMNEGASC